jgi:hypothetical protein
MFNEHDQLTKYKSIIDFYVNPMARPMPPPAPVTIAALPLIENPFSDKVLSPPSSCGLSSQLRWRPIESFAPPPAGLHPDIPNIACRIRFCLSQKHPFVS